MAQSLRRTVRRLWRTKSRTTTGHSRSTADGISKEKESRSERYMCANVRRVIYMRERYMYANVRRVIYMRERYMCANVHSVIYNS